MNLPVLRTNALVFAAGLTTGFVANFLLSYATCRWYRSKRSLEQNKPLNYTDKDSFGENRNEN